MIVEGAEPGSMNAARLSSTQEARSELNAPVTILPGRDPKRIEAIVDSAIFVTSIHGQGNVLLVLA